MQLVKVPEARGSVPAREVVVGFAVAAAVGQSQVGAGLYVVAKQVAAALIALQGSADPLAPLYLILA